MQQVEVTIKDEVPSNKAWLLLPRPIDDWTQNYLGIQLNQVETVHEIKALNSRQRAFVVQPTGNKNPTVNYRFCTATEPPPDWIWQLENNRYTQASTELILQVTKIAGEPGNQQSAIHTLIEHTASVFGYDHSEQRFNDGSNEVPAICGTAKGSCVDINTYLIASARCLGIPVQYMAGYWFHPDKTDTLDMHCWLAFNLEGEVIFWDLAHHLKWGVKRLEPGLNPAGGRRVTMSYGRGLRFDTPNGKVTISHFSEPLWILPDGSTLSPKISIHIID